MIVIAGLMGLTGGWLYYGYRSMNCHPMFATSDPEATCNMLVVLASEHVLIVMRTLMPYSQIFTEQRELLILVMTSAIVGAIVTQVAHRIMRRRQRRHLGAFPDVRGFRPIEDMEDV